MTEADIQLIIQRALEKYPGFAPRLISDRGPQFIAKEFKGYIRQMGMRASKRHQYVFGNRYRNRALALSLSTAVTLKQKFSRVIFTLDHYASCPTRVNRSAF